MQAPLPFSPKPLEAAVCDPPAEDSNPLQKKVPFFLGIFPPLPVRISIPLRRLLFFPHIRRAFPYDPPLFEEGPSQKAPFLQLELSFKKVSYP